MLGSRILLSLSCDRLEGLPAENQPYRRRERTTSSAQQCCETRDAIPAAKRAEEIFRLQLGRLEGVGGHASTKWGGVEIEALR